MIEKFKINIPDTHIKEIYNKVKNYPWHEMPNDGGWDYGTNIKYMRKISAYWVKKFNWRKHDIRQNKRYAQRISLLEAKTSHNPRIRF